MKLKSFLIILIITFSSVYANPKICAKATYNSFVPNLAAEDTLLDFCHQYARMLGYDESLIKEAHFVTLPGNVVGKCIKEKNKCTILVNYTYGFSSRNEFDENLVHEICHVYTSNDLEWHLAMMKAAKRFPWLSYYVLEDEKTDHPLD
jgi:hypothetical protein